MKFPFKPMGGLANESAHERPSAQPPIDVSVSTCLQSFLKFSPPTHKKSYAKIQYPRKFFNPLFIQLRPI